MEDNQIDSTSAILNCEIVEDELVANIGIGSKGNDCIQNGREISSCEYVVENASVGDEDCADFDDIDYTKSLIGLKREKLDDIYDMYKKYANATGFSVKKSTSRGISEKYFCCSCEGKSKTKETVPLLISDVGQSSSKKKRKRSNITRTNCKVSLRVKFVDGIWEVIHHMTEHNHNLTRTEWQHLHRSERRIGEVKRLAIESFEAAGVRPSLGYRLLSHEAGGEENVGHTIRDQINFISRLRMRAIEGGDAQKVIDNLHELNAENEDFFFRVKLDEEGKFNAIFWRDGMMMEDYNIFGDVVVFDTTYRTNKYNLICGPFVGVNNHWSNTMFGCAFIADEKTDTFVWVLEMFLKSMGGKQPITIFTDQDLAMSKAIEKVFNKSRHRLCLWHLQQNAVSHFGQLKKDTPFKRDFDYCLKSCRNVLEFEDRWEKMMVDYNLRNNSWFQRLYGLKEKWATAFSKDFFSAGILSSQRCESANNSISFNASKRTNLTRFFSLFNSTIQQWRSTERKNEFDCSRSLPRPTRLLPGLLRHASEIYTLRLYSDIESEFTAAMSSKVYETIEIGSSKMYSIALEEEPGAKEEVYFVQDANGVSINCSCMQFESVGLLCFHCLRVLFMHSISEIPAQYVLKTWTKMAKNEVWNKQQAKSLESLKVGDVMPWRHKMSRKYYNLLLKCEKNPNAKRILEDGIERDSLAIQQILSNNVDGDEYSGTNSGVGSICESAPAVLDPTFVKTKGRSRRLKGKFERQKSTTREFGSKTPNPQLL